jgi:hypothetical protein
MGQSPVMTEIYRSILTMDDRQLVAFRRDLRRRHSKEDLLKELKQCAERVGASPTMREFLADPKTAVHPQTLVDQFGTWNEAKRAAGLRPRRNATRDELVSALQELGASLGRKPTVRDIAKAKGRMPGKSAYVKEFGSVSVAVAAAGFDTLSSDERLERSLRHAAELLRRTGRVPSFRAWDRMCKGRDDLLSAWQIYRSFNRPALGGSWGAFQSAAREHAMVTA